MNVGHDYSCRASRRAASVTAFAKAAAGLVSGAPERVKMPWAIDGKRSAMGISCKSYRANGPFLNGDPTGARANHAAIFRLLCAFLVLEYYWRAFQGLDLTTRDAHHS